ncbi:MAG TPA: DNA polymerase ligase N-terminal domain-containing protein [Longimicrobiales bacterium]|nr:DNA polymerase ligase N-terminal domain-containing protein [Longimicrobiales bacterium]
MTKEEQQMAQSKRGSTAKRRQSGGRAKAPLEEYRRKRDFEKTREPAGGATKSRRRGLQFVIQKHAASSLHYDLRLELDGVMKSWAVPKGPSLDPSVKRLAMQVEDHPIEYNTFEGTIPQGEYGGGTVMLWDRGTYVPDEPKKGEDAASAVRRGLASGKLSFTFDGERLNGSFALVRTERGEKPKWLLIKHRDDTASEDAEITDVVQTSVASGRTMEEIAAENERVWRSDRGGEAGGEEAGKAPAQAAAGMIAPMRPKPAESVPSKGKWTAEPWRGGERVLAYVTGDTAVLMDERGRDVTKRHRSIADELVSLAKRVKRPFVLDGEIADGDEKSGSGASRGSGRAAKSGRATTAADDRAVLHAADLLLDGDDVLMEEPWTDRRSALETLFRRRRLKEVAIQPVSDDSKAMLRRAEKQGWPGILARKRDASYEPGTRSDALLRVAVH